MKRCLEARGSGGGVEDLLEPAKKIRSSTAPTVCLGSWGGQVVGYGERLQMRSRRMHFAAESEAQWEMVLTPDAGTSGCDCS